MPDGPAAVPDAARGELTRHSLAGVSIPTIPGTNIPFTASRSTGLALSVAAVFRARQLNADTLASLPFRTATPDSAPLLPDPSATQTMQDFLTETILSLEDYGDAYWWVRYGSSNDVQVIPADEVVVSWEIAATPRGSRTPPVTSRMRRIYTWGQRRMRTDGLDPPLVVLSINRGRTDLTGYGPMQSPRIAGLLAEQQWSQEYFENSGEPTGVLSAPGEVTKTEADALRDQWIENRQIRGPAVIGGGLEYDSTSFNPTDSAWVETHLAGVGDAATLFGVPSVLLNHNQPGSSLTYQSIPDVYQAYWRMTLRPTYGTMIERAYGRIIGIAGVHLDPEQLFLASMRERAFSASLFVQTGWDPAAALDVVGLPPMPHTGAVSVYVQPESDDQGNT
jgi:phage portal protein BeeE